MDGNTRYAIAGYATVYEYYAYPDNTRPRISQMLVLPPFQRIGVGLQLLEKIYKYYISQPRVVDITGLFCILLNTVECLMLCNYRLRKHKYLFQRASCHFLAALGTFSLYSMIRDTVTKLQKHVLLVTGRKRCIISYSLF